MGDHELQHLVHGAHEEDDPQLRHSHRHQTPQEDGREDGAAEGDATYKDTVCVSARRQLAGRVIDSSWTQPHINQEKRLESPNLCIRLTGSRIGAVGNLFRGMMDVAIFLAQPLCCPLLVQWGQLLQRVDFAVTRKRAFASRYCIQMKEKMESPKEDFGYANL